MRIHIAAQKILIGCGLSEVLCQRNYWIRAICGQICSNCWKWWPNLWFSWRMLYVNSIMLALSLAF